MTTKAPRKGETDKKYKLKRACKLTLKDGTTITMESDPRQVPKAVYDQYPTWFEEA